MRIPNPVRCFLFEVRWFWKNRTWASTRQKYKAFDKDFARFKLTGDTPW